MLFQIVGLDRSRTSRPNVKFTNPIADDDPYISFFYYEGNQPVEDHPTERHSALAYFTDHLVKQQPMRCKEMESGACNCNLKYYLTLCTCMQLRMLSVPI